MELAYPGNLRRWSRMCGCSCRTTMRKHRASSCGFPGRRWSAISFARWRRVRFDEDSSIGRQGSAPWLGSSRFSPWSVSPVSGHCRADSSSAQLTVGVTVVRSCAVDSRAGRHRLATAAPHLHRRRRSNVASPSRVTVQRDRRVGRACTSSRSISRTRRIGARRQKLTVAEIVSPKLPALTSCPAGTRP